MATAVSICLSCRRMFAVPIPPPTASACPPLTFEAMTKQIDDYFDQWRSAWTGDFKNARSVSERLEEEAMRNPQSIVGLVGPALAHVVGVYYSTLATRNGTQVVLELHAYRATNGK